MTASCRLIRACHAAARRSVALTFGIGPSGRRVRPLGKKQWWPAPCAARGTRRPAEERHAAPPCRRRDRPGLPAGRGPGRSLGLAPRDEEHRRVHARGKVRALVPARDLGRLRDVRRERHDVAGVRLLHLRAQEHLASLHLARLQPDFPHGLHERLDAALEGAYGRRVDRDPVRPQGSAVLSHLSMVAYAIVTVIALLAYSFKGIGKFAVVMLPWRFTGNAGRLQRREHLRHHVHGAHRPLRDQGRDDQRRLHRDGPVHHPGHSAFDRRGCRHVEGFARE